MLGGNGNDAVSRTQQRPFDSCSIQLSMSPATSEDALDDSEEWKAALAAFKMYKAAYGDLKIPQLFVVPNMPPWPRVSWGLRLGKVVYAIRSTGRYMANASTRTARRQVLDQLGFVWSVRRSVADGIDEGIRLEQIVKAARVYGSVVGNVADIPDNYVVPDEDAWPESVRGLPLGRQLEAIKRSKNETVRNKLTSLGIPAEVRVREVEHEVDGRGSVPPSPLAPLSPAEIAKALEEGSEGSPDRPTANDVRFQNVYAALSTYRKLYDDLLVPQPFVVPKDSQWPKDIWGLRLGARVNAIRSQGTFVNNNAIRRKLLDDLGFNWSPPKERRRGRSPKDVVDVPSENISDDIDFSDEADAESADNLEVDTLFDGSFDFGKDFDMPSDGDKPSPTWNLDSASLPEINAKAAAAQDAAMKEDEYTEPRTLAESLEEATARALECGIIEGLTAKKRVIKGKREKDIPWFNDDFGDDFVFEDVVETLTVYKSIFGDLTNLTNSDFVVPAPKEVTGFLDDDSLETFDVDASARAAAAIASFEEQGQADRSEDFIAAEIKRLQREVGQPYEKESRIAVLEAQSFAGKWPEHLAGMALGSIATRMRDGSLEVKHIPERKAQLDAIGFEWGDPKYFIDVPFEKAVCAMYAYFLVRGDMFVQENFIMPDEDPWPQALAGYELGQAVKRLRELQNFLEAYHPEKVSLLRMIDFVWFADTLALPLDPNETEMTPETLLLSAMGHPDFAKMIDIPMGLPDKLVADGPFMETDDDPKLWWRKWHNWEYVKDYWYQQGRRDNGYALRAMGYPRMADEHEAKYGPGLFSQIDKVMADLDNGGAKRKGPEEKKVLLEQLNYFRQEMLGCSDIHPHERDKILSDLDTQMLIIANDANMDTAIADELDTAAFKHEAANGAEKKASNNYEEEEDMEEEENDDDRGSLVEEEFDVEDELGLGGEPW